MSDGAQTPDDDDALAGRGDSAARQGIQSVEIAVRVLQALEEGRGPMTLTQVATAAGMSASKVHRYLVSLGRGGLVSQSQQSGAYDLGVGMRRLGVEALRRVDEVSLASEHLPGLRDRTGHAVNLAVWGDRGPVLVRWFYGAHPLPVTVRVGATMPLLASAVGRVYLAHLPDAVTGPVLAAEPGADPAEVARVAAEVRSTGVAVASGTLIPTLTSVAAPVFPAGGSAPLAVALAVPSSLATPALLAALEDELLAATAEITADLGGALPAARRAE
ncbi:IclR family transcriptional regulator [Quadrisphaera granulorum]|uniref:IclR family transcriptional regulator n=1 Tax=Quadrisphaera granulorum TaxID=317664 RepID=UPI001B871BAF|nr:IclR family transcriptional regulator [Quadrisphaera granulorum]